MTGETRILAIWGGSFLVLIITIWLVLGSRADTLTDLRTHASDLVDKFGQLYPDQGESISQATHTWSIVAKAQEAALAQGESYMLPTLPKTYQDPDLSSATAQVQNDLQYLREKAERLKVVLPRSLPLEEGLDPDPHMRAMQLGKLYLYRTLLDLMMDTGINQITSVKEGRSYTDTGGRYAALGIGIRCACSWSQADALIIALNANSPRICLHDLGLTYDSTTYQLGFEGLLLCANDPAWGLRPLPVPAASAVDTEGEMTKSGGQ
jgi:hypothetical protein